MIAIVVWPVASLVFGTGNPLLALAFLPLTLVINYFLLRGERWIWWLVVASHPFYILTVITSHLGWYYVVASLVTLALLLLPESRRHVFGREDEVPT